MKMDELVREIAGALDVARIAWCKRGCGKAGDFLETLSWAGVGHSTVIAREYLAPILTAALDEHAAKHLAEHAIVTRETLGLLERLDAGEPGGDPHGICILSDGTGDIVECTDRSAVGFAENLQHKTTDDALRSLLKPPEKPTRTAILQDAKLIIGDGDARQTYKLVALELETTS